VFVSLPRLVSHWGRTSRFHM